MKEYIANLTNNIIGKNNYAQMWDEMDDPDEFVGFVMIDLAYGDLQVMKMETLGKIMGSFELGDVQASKEELLRGVYFTGDCKEFQIALVASCLARVIRDRLDPFHYEGIPSYRRKRKVRSKN